jgi:hypothetical protein
MTHRIAVARLKLQTGEILKNQIVEWTNTTTQPTYYPLTQELHSTKWYKMTFCLKTQKFI